MAVRYGMLQIFEFHFFRREHNISILKDLVHRAVQLLQWLRNSSQRRKWEGDKDENWPFLSDVGDE